ncbi:MAG: hypothetical protein J6B34_04420 [Clostridia bacterium]|nr:hypothetical protein [Clostridia bacterium]
MFDFFKKLFGGKSNETKQVVTEPVPDTYVFGHNLTKEHGTLCNAIRKTTKSQILSKEISRGGEYSCVKVAAKNGYMEFKLVMPKYEGDIPVLSCKYVVENFNYFPASQMGALTSFNKTTTYINATIDTTYSMTATFAHYEIAYTNATIEDNVRKFISYIGSSAFYYASYGILVKQY